jgi:hypothetical protein
VGATRSPARQGEASPSAISELDFVARLASAWDRKGGEGFSDDGAEHRALICLAGLTGQIATYPWSNLSARERYALVLGARRAIDFGRRCAWVFGQ